MTPEAQTITRPVPLVAIVIGERLATTLWSSFLHPAGLADTQLLAVDCMEQVTAGIQDARRVASPRVESGPTTRCHASERAAIVPREIVRLFGVYIAHAGLSVPSQASFERNLAAKASSGAFVEVSPLLRAGVAWDPASALEWLRHGLLPLLEG